MTVNCGFLGRSEKLWCPLAPACRRPSFAPFTTDSATVLQPGRYRLVRKVALEAGKMLQNSQITGHASTDRNVGYGTYKEGAAGSTPASPTYKVSFCKCKMLHGKGGSGGAFRFSYCICTATRGKRGLRGALLAWSSLWVRKSGCFEDDDCGAVAEVLSGRY